MSDRTSVLILGYIKDGYFLKYIPYGIINIIKQFYDIFYMIFNSKGYCYNWSKNSRYFAINGNKPCIINSDNELYLNGCLMIKNVKSCVISNSISYNDSMYVWTYNNELYSSKDVNQYDNAKISRLFGKFDSSVIQIECGWYHSVFLTLNGNVYGYINHDRFYKMGLPLEYNENISQFQQILTGHNITKIGCSNKTTFMLDSNNILKVFGKDLLTWNTPYQFLILTTDIINFNCGSNHLGLITKYGNLYMHGYNEYWQCGLNNINNKNIYSNLNEIKINGDIIDVQCGDSHTIIKSIQSKQDIYYSFGSNTHKELLLNNNILYCLPSLISFQYIKHLTKSHKNIINLIPSMNITYILQEK